MVPLAVKQARAVVENLHDAIELLDGAEIDAGPLVAMLERECKLYRTPAGPKYHAAMPLSMLAVLRLLGAADVKKSIQRLRNQLRQLDEWDKKHGTEDDE